MRTLNCLTHTAPDLDALGSSWLLERYYLAPRELRTDWGFIPFTGVAPAVLEAADAIVDIGGEYEPTRLRFDHHHLADPRATCATRQVYDFVRESGADVDYLEPLVALIQAGDTGQLGRHGWALSAELGLHALVAGIALQADEIVTPQLHRHSDVELQEAHDRIVRQRGWQLLDALDLKLRARAEVVKGWAQTVAYNTAGVVALSGCAFGGIGLAFDNGAQVVVSESQRALPRTYALEVWVQRDLGLDLRQLWPAVVEQLTSDHHRGVDDVAAMYVERAFAVRGTRKAPNPNPPNISAAELAQVIDAVWTR